MARFYGILRGKAKTEATRTGSPSSGLAVIMKGWRGAIRVDLSVREGEDWFEVWHETNEGNKLVAEGRLS